MTSTQNVNPSVVLVHGAYADGSSWSEVIKRLQAAGITATAVQNPLTSLAGDVAHTRRVLARQPGPVLLAVTTSLHIDFLRKPALVDVVADGHLMKLGKHLGVVDVGLRSDGHDELVAKAQVTYSIPPR